MKETRLSIDMKSGNEYVSLDSFVEAIQEFRAMLANVKHGSAQPPDWRITELSVASAHAAVEAFVNPEAGVVVAAITLKGLTALESGQEPPEEFRPALRHAKNLAGVARSTGMSLAVGNGDRILQVTERTLKHADMILSYGTREETWGSVEGRLEMLSLRGGLQCSIYDDLNDDRIECRIEGSLLEDVKDAFGQRVLASGHLRRDSQGRARSIRVTQLLPFPRKEDLPSIDRISGIAPNITNGLSVKEYIRRLRDGQ